MRLTVPALNLHQGEDTLIQVLQDGEALSNLHGSYCLLPGQWEKQSKAGS